MQGRKVKGPQAQNKEFWKTGECSEQEKWCSQENSPVGYAIPSVSPQIICKDVTAYLQTNNYMVEC